LRRATPTTRQRMRIFRKKKTRKKRISERRPGCVVRESDMVFTSGSAGGDADRAQPLGLGFLLV
jgi:hypothetical protein